MIEEPLQDRVKDIYDKISIEANNLLLLATYLPRPSQNLISTTLHEQGTGVEYVIGLNIYQYEGPTIYT